MTMKNMPEYKEGHVTLWREGAWIQVHMEDMAKIIEEDNKSTEAVTVETYTGDSDVAENSPELSAGA